MIDFQQKNKINKILYSKVTLVILFILIIFMFKAAYNIFIKNRINNENYSAIKKNYDSLISRKDMLDSEIARLNTEAGIEEEIRGRFSVAKPGETVVVIVNSNSGTITDSNAKNSGFWKSILNIFGL